MNVSKQAFLLFLAWSLFNAGVGFSAPSENSGDELHFIRKGVEMDQFSRVINDPNSGKINFSTDTQNIKATIKEKTKAKSFSSSPPPENTLSANIDLQHHLSLSRDGLSLKDNPLFKEDWKVGILGSGIGKSGITTVDIDNDGVIEIISGGSTSTFGLNNFWYISEYSKKSQGYQMHWISDLYPVGISSIAAVNVDNSGSYNIFVGLANGNIHIYDGATLKEVDHIDSPASTINRILFADGDNDAINEIIVCDDENMFFYDAISHNLKHQISYGASDFEVGNVDSDPSYEIVLANGLVLEFDGVTTSVEWDYSQGDFGYLIELADIDSDNRKEIIGASSWNYVTAFDADTQSPKWQIPTDLDVDALLVRDVDNDGIEEVLYGDGQWGEIHCYDAVTVKEKWQIKNPDHGVTDIAVLDTDADGDLEVLWGAGASSTGADHLYVYGVTTLSFEWKSQHIDAPFHAIDVGDVDSDGQQEIVFASYESNSGYDDGVIFIFDAKTHALEWQSDENMFGGHAWTGIHDLRIGDVDDDGEQEIAVATDRLYDGAIYIINGITHEMEQSYFYDDGAPIYAIAIADVDNDGETEIIAGGGREHTGAPGVYVYVIKGSTGEVEWHSINLGSYWSEVYALEVGDIDSDGVPEIVAVNDHIFVFDGISHQQWQSTLNGYYGVDLYDIDNDNVNEIIVGTSNGNIFSIDGQIYEEKFLFNASSSSITGLRAYDIGKDGNIELIFSSSGSLNVYSVQDSILLWRSKMLGASAGDYNSLVVSDIDSDKLPEVIIATNHAVIEFESSATKANIMVSPESHDFGDVNIGNTSLFQNFTISNMGDGEMEIGSVNLMGSDATEFNMHNDNCSNQTIAPYVSCTLYVTITPKSEGAKNANLEIPSNDPDANPLRVSLIGNGVAINNPPVADAGPDQMSDEGTAVMLDGSGSYDPDADPLTFIWTQIKGPVVTINDTHSSTPAFETPEVDEDTILTFELSVSDGIEESNHDQVNITVKSIDSTSDLTGEWIRFNSRSFSGGTRIIGSLQVSNVGNQYAGGFRVSYYLSSDGITRGKLLRTRSMRRGLRASHSKKLGLRYYSRRPLSGKYIIAVIDSDNQVSEADENNNEIGKEIH